VEWPRWPRYGLQGIRATWGALGVFQLQSEFVPAMLTLPIELEAISMSCSSQIFSSGVRQ
jgi:hypothetical protein